VMFETGSNGQMLPGETERYFTLLKLLQATNRLDNFGNYIRIVDDSEENAKKQIAYLRAKTENFADEVKTFSPLLGSGVGAGLNLNKAKVVENKLANLTKNAIIEGPSNAEVEWLFRNIPEGVTTIDGRQYSRHALERMAPDTPEIRAELRTKYNKIAEEKGVVPGSKEYNNFINKNIDPRGITPSVVEDAIRNTKPTPGNTEGTFVHENANVRVIVNSNGDVVTVIPR